MPLPLEIQIPLAAALVTLLLVWAAEKLHQRRCRTVARLATGPAAGPRRWVAGVPLIRAVSLAGMAWAITTLFYVSGGQFSQRSAPEDRRKHTRHVVFVADLSPSMLLPDAGPDGDLTRAGRAHQVVDAILRRLDGDLLFSVIGFYTDAIPVVLDARDTNLVRNVFDGLPVWYVMQSGKTDLGHGVRATLDHLRDYPENSTTVFLCTDGDTVDLGSVSKPPASVREIYVLGVGNPHQGTFIDDHMSRQDAAVLRTLAGRLRGQYVDVNEQHLSTLSLGALATGSGGSRRVFGLVDMAIFVFAAAAAVQALLPLLLEWFGSDWRAVRVTRPLTTPGAGG
jgi:Ca-activated chloride channel family protein